MALTEWGLTAVGFYCPTFEEILAENIKQAKYFFGDDIDVSELTPLGKFIRISAAESRKLYESLESVYYGLSPITATGVSLDRLCALVGIRRRAATCTVHKIRVYGTYDSAIPAGTLFRSRAGIKYYATTDAVITDEEPAQEDSVVYYTELLVQCVDAGTAGNVRNINAPVAVSNNITSVEYVSTVSLGEDTETDEALRTRFNEVVNGLGSNTNAAIIASVLSIGSGSVYGCKIKNNTSDSSIAVSDKLTVFKDSYAVIVYAGNSPTDSLSKTIAAAIYKKQPCGVRQSGNVVVSIIDAAGEEQPVKFNYVDEKIAAVTVSCKVSSEFPLGGSDIIRDNISSYINNLEIGEALIWSQLYSCIYAVPGVVKVTDLKVENGTEDITATLTDIIKAGSITVSVTTGA